MLELAVTISALAFVLKCLKFIWKVEQDKQDKNKKNRRLLPIDDG